MSARLKLGPASAAERATPPCPHFGPCGGCQLQHLAYPAQLARKAEYLRALLAPHAPELQVHPSPPLAYRNRIRLTLARTGGQLRAGYLGSADPASPEDSAQYATAAGPDEPLAATASSAKTTFLPITECPIAAPLLWRAAEAFLALAATQAWLNTATLEPDQLELFTSADESRLNLTLYLRTAQRELPRRTAESFTVLCDKLRTENPQLTGAGISLLPPASATRSRRAEAARPGPSWGQPGLNYRVPLTPGDAATENTTYWVPRTAFFQINRFLLPDLLNTVLDSSALAPSHELAWDLYAGAGLFSRPLAAGFSEVTAVEIAEPAATALAQTKLPNLRAAKATTLDFLRAAALQRERPDLILLDPPRTGAGPEVCALLARIAAPVLIYISCSPAHLAADLVALAAAGYSLSNLHLFDLFPQTTHMEGVVVLTR